MAIHCGFFNSKDGDRRYTARDMTKPYDLLVSDGVFATPTGTPSDYLQVFANDGMRIRVAYGRGLFFGGMWFENDSDYFLTLDLAEVTLKRIDSIVVRVDESEAIRKGDIIIKKGTPSSEPVPPQLERTPLVMEYRLANITVDAGVTSIPQAKISDRRPYKDECGWVTSLVQQVDTTTLWNQFNDDYWTFRTDRNEEFYTWFNDIKEHLSTSTLIRTFTNYYVTTKQDETVIPIDIPQFTYNLDILQVYINGLMLIRDLEYTSTNDNEITLTNGVDVGTPISFVIYKSVDGRDAETVIEEIERLQADVALLQSGLSDEVKAREDLAGLVDIYRATKENGDVKIIVNSGQNVLTACSNAGRGIHTLYAPNDALGIPKTIAGRYIGHMASSTNGWILCFCTDGSIYSNHFLNGTWREWRVIHEVNPAPLWSNTTGYVMSVDQIITPSKPLNQCAHGWQLVWADSDGIIDVTTSLIPKKTHKNTDWNGQGMLFSIPIDDLTGDGSVNMCAKRLTVTNTTLTGHTVNNATEISNDTHLFAIYEY